MGPPASIRNNIPPGPSVIVGDIFTFSPWSAGLYHTGYYACPFTRIIWRYVTAICAQPHPPHISHPHFVPASHGNADFRVGDMVQTQHRYAGHQIYPEAYQ